MYIFGVVSLTTIFRLPTPPPNIVQLNDAVITLGYGSEDLAFLTSTLAYVFDDMDTTRQNRDNNLHMSLLVFLTLLSLLGILLYLRVQRQILTPFNRLQDFARRVAEGHLDIPLKMDKNNSFGAFSESFDIMREELRKANQSKKELVASLSHDIKTPIASIKAITELMLVKTTDEKEQARLNTITAKAEQINALITNMFNATLEELQVLQVNPTENSSTELKELIKNADYDNRVMPFEIPPCLVLADILRLQQVFDNIISNSYKYAGTDICVSSYYIDGFLAIELQDFGVGVPDEDIGQIFNKFHRGKNASGISGQGLGLHISKYFMTQMLGDISCRNKNGFAVVIKIKLAE